MAIPVHICRMVENKNCHGRGKYNLGEGYIQESMEKKFFDSCKVAFASCTLSDAETTI